MPTFGIPVATGVEGCWRPGTPRDFAKRFAAHPDPGTPRTLTAAGPVDFSTAAQCGDQLLQASRGAVYPLAADRSELAMLASAGVRVLFELRDRRATRGNTLRLVAETGSPDQAVLDLVGLGYQARDGR